MVYLPSVGVQLIVCSLYGHIGVGDLMMQVLKLSGYRENEQGPHTCEGMEAPVYLQRESAWLGERSLPRTQGILARVPGPVYLWKPGQAGKSWVLSGSWRH